MAPTGQLTEASLQALLQDGKLTGNWTLDASRSSIGLRSKSVWGLVPVKGVFHQVAGEGTVSASGQVSGTITVAAATIDTKMAKRDTHLRSADFFDSDNHPQITFSVDQVAPSGPGVTVSGRLTVRDQTKPVTFGATVTVPGDGEVWLDAEVPVNRSDFGLTWNQLGMSSTHNIITVHAVFTRA